MTKAIGQLEAICKGGAFEHRAELVQELRTLGSSIALAMTSERGRLSGAAIQVTAILASGLDSAFEPLLPLFFPTLLHLCTKASKLVVSRAHACVTSIVETTQLPAILPYLMYACKDKSSTCRMVAADGVMSCLNCFNPPDLEKDARAKMIEDIIRLTARDASAEVRKISRKLFDAYKTLLPSRVDKCVTTYEIR